MQSALRQLTAIAAFALAGAANASLIVDEMEINEFVNYSNRVAEWTHDINGAPISSGEYFSPSTHHADSAHLAIEFEDDKGLFLCIWGRCERRDEDKAKEWAVIQIENFDLEDGGVFEIDTGTLGFNVGATGLLSLNQDGLLDVVINRLAGDFWVLNSTLMVDVKKDSTSDDTPTTAVAEPTTLAVFGLALLAIAVVRQRLV